MISSAIGSGRGFNLLEEYFRISVSDYATDQGKRNAKQSYKTSGESFEISNRTNLSIKEHTLRENGSKSVS